MPEGPEIRLAADEVANILKGRKTTDVFFGQEHLVKFENQLKGQKVIDVQSRGKAILTIFDNDRVIYSHNQLYGKWLTVKRGEIPDSSRQLRLAIHNRFGSALLYSASDIDVLHRNELRTHTFLSKLGPDLLSETPSVLELTDRLSDKRFRNKQLAGLLLDQGFVAGLGNYLRAEILLYSRLHPLTKPAQCTRQELRRLASKIISLTLRSYKTKGVTNPPSLVRLLKSTGCKTKESFRFSVYGREGSNCYHCDRKVKRMDAGGRHIYFCPGCQPIKVE